MIAIECHVLGFVGETIQIQVKNNDKRSSYCNTLQSQKPRDS